MNKSFLVLSRSSLSLSLFGYLFSIFCVCACVRFTLCWFHTFSLRYSLPLLGYCRGPVEISCCRFSLAHCLSLSSTCILAVVGCMCNWKSTSKGHRDPLQTTAIHNVLKGGRWPTIKADVQTETKDLRPSSFPAFRLQ